MEYVKADDKLPMSVKLLAIIMIIAGFLLIINSFNAPPHQLTKGAIERSPIAGRVGAFIGTIGLPLLLILSAIYLMKRNRYAFYFTILLSIVDIVTIIKMIMIYKVYIYLYYHAYVPFYIICLS